MNKSIKNKWILIISVCTFMLTFIPDIHGQNYNPNTLDFLKRSLNFLMAGDYQNAIISCNEVIRRDPHSALNYVLRGRAYYELTEYDKAIADFSHAIRLDRNNTSAFVLRGNSHRQMGDITKAVTDWEAALRINPDNPEAKRNLELARPQ